MTKSKQAKAPRPHLTAVESEAKPVTKEFTFKLSDAEVAVKAREMAQLDGEIMQLEQELAKSSAEFKAKIKDRDALRHKISSAVRRGEEERVVDALMVKAFPERLVQFYLKSENGSMTLLEERAMTESETQMELDDIAESTSKAKAEKMRAKRKAEGNAAEPDRTKADQVQEDIGQTIKAETSKRTKRSSVDGAYGNA